MYKYINWVNNKSINFIKVNELITSSINSGRFTNYGPNVQLLENTLRRILEIQENKSVIVVSNGSAALQVLAAGIEIYHNTTIQWATQAFTFPPTTQGTLKETKILDIDLDGGLDLEEITDDIHGNIITNVFGNVVDINKYEVWAKNHNKYLIFDNAATSYTFYRDINAINYGIGCGISLHHTKPIGFGEGGGNYS